MGTNRIRAGLVMVAGAFALALTAVPASADIIYDSSIVALGQGFGAVPRLLTVQQTGSSPNPAGIESACDSNVAGVLSTTTCSGADATFLGNGLIDVGGDNVNGPKNALINLASQGVTDPSQIILVYNPSQTGSSPATDILDITLKFYDASNHLVISIDGGCGSSCVDGVGDSLFFSGTGVNLGNGGTGFGLVIDAIQSAAIRAACGVNLSGCVTLAAETTIWNANDGPDSFLFFTQGGTSHCTPGVDCPVPEPITLSLFGAGLAGAVAVARRRRKQAT